MATWYIASTTATPAGNDANAGTSSALPKATIASVHTAAASGDTVIVKASTGSIVWTNQTFTKNLTIQGESVPVYNPLTKAWTGAILNAAAATIQWMVNSTSLAVSNLIFTNAVGSTSNTGYFAFDNTSTARTLTIQRCVFYSNGGGNFNNGMVIRPAPNWSITLVACAFYVLSGSGLLSSKSFYGGFSTGSVTVTNCVMVSNAWEFARLDSGMTAPWTIKNNTFVNTGTSAAFFADSSPTGVVYNNNCAFGAWTSIPSGSNNLTSDPMLVDLTNGDFRLRPGAPGINTGVAL